MADPKMVEQFEAALEGANGTPPQATPETSQVKTPQEKIEELEIALNGKPFRLPLNVELPIKHNGKIEKQPLGNVLNTWRNATHLDERARAFKAEQEAFQKDRNGFDIYKQFRDKHGEIDLAKLERALEVQMWSEKDPKGFDKLWGLYEKKDVHLADQGQTQPFLDTIKGLEDRLHKTEGVLKEYENYKLEEMIAKDTEAVKADIEKFRKEWPEVDLNEKGVDGVPLTSMIMKHGLDKGIPEFKLAALDYLGSRLLDIAQQRGRTEAVKGVRKDAQQGILARSGTPFNGQSPPADPSKMTKSERLAAAKADYERLVSGT